jgi:hypothetical protein
MRVTSVDYIPTESDAQALAEALKLLEEARARITEPQEEKLIYSVKLSEHELHKLAFLAMQSEHVRLFLEQDGTLTISTPGGVV